MSSLTKAIVLAATLLWSAPALATPGFVNGLALPGDTVDLRGDRLGYFSDIYYDLNRNEWWALGDRGPGGGTLSYDTRVQRFTIDVNATTGAISNFKVVQTIVFTNAAGTVPFNGLAPSPTNVLGRAFDPEGFVVVPKTGRFLVSDEYGPSLYEFNRDGTLHRTFTTPSNLIPRNSVNEPNFAGDAGNDRGKRTNRGFEGLAVSPDGKFTYAMLQSAMLDEGGGNGVYARIVKFDNATGEAVAQYAYKMEGASQGRGISALVALNDHEFLVLERNNRGVGVDSELTPPNKKVFKIDLNGATDVTSKLLPGNALDPLPSGVVLVTKEATPFMDLGADTLAAFGNRVPEKFEGLSIGLQLASGQYLILVGTDNDFSITQDLTSGIQFDEYFRFSDSTTERIRCDRGTFLNCTSVNSDGTLGDPFSGDTDGFGLLPGLLYAYLSGPGDLASFVRPVPAPWSAALVLLGMAAMALGRRHRRRA